MRKKNGRPLAEIDQKMFEGLCAVQCTQAEICAYFDVDDKTLTAWCKRKYKKSFSEIFQQKRSAGKISLRRKGFQMAHEVPSVHIFYAKNFLGMRDNPEETQNADIGKKIADAISKLQGEPINDDVHD